MRFLEINPRSQSIISSPLPPKSSSPPLPLVPEMRRNTLPLVPEMRRPLPLVPEMRRSEERQEKEEREENVRDKYGSKEDEDECQIVHQDKPTSSTTLQSASQVDQKLE